jgi:hypothetical protein
VTTSKLDATILKYLKPEITSQPQAQTVYEDSNVSFSVSAEGKYLTYQWKKDGVDLAGETNATLKITDANATLHDGNYSVVVSNDFGSVESGEVLVDVNTTWSTDGLVGWWKFDEGSGTVAYDSSGNGNDGNLMNGPTWTDGKVGGALSFDGDSFVEIGAILPKTYSKSLWINASSIEQEGNNIFSWDGKHALYVPNGKLSSGHNNSWGIVKDNEIISLFHWYYVALTYNSSSKEMILFKNGLVVSTGQVADCGELIRSQIGAFKSSYCFKGLIDDVRIYDRALSAAEVQALYNLGH